MTEILNKNYVVVDSQGIVHSFYISEMAESMAKLKGSSSVKVLEKDESEREMLRDWLLGLLKTEEVTLTFEKKDGTMRVMRCTLREDKRPPYESKGTKATNGNVIPVFDLDANAWRSFRVDSVRRIEFEFEA